MGGEFDSAGASLSYASYAPVARPVRGLLERPDGNNVSVERESLLLAETQMKFNLGVQLLKDEFHSISQAINSEEGHRHESVWHAGSERLGAGRGALAGGSGGGEYGERGDHAHRAGRGLPAADCWCSGPSPCRGFRCCWRGLRKATPDGGVRVERVVADTVADADARYEPGHPDADARGM